MKYLFLFLLLLSGCASKHVVINEMLTEYVSDNKMSWNLDSTIIKDKSFKLQIPQGLKSKLDWSSDAFMHVLYFSEDQKITLIYKPNTKRTVKGKYENLTYSEFERICTEANILNCIESLPITKKGRFGLRDTGQGNCYAIYMNIKSNNLNTFNTCIESAIYN